VLRTDGSPILNVNGLGIGADRQEDAGLLK